MNESFAKAKIIWDYLLMHETLRPMDAIIAFGSNDTRVAEKAVLLYRQNYAPYVIFSGASGKESYLAKAEAEVFADIAIAGGVPAEKIIKESQSTNSGENIIFTKKLLQENNLNFNSFILVHKPYVERRIYATFRKQWPEADCLVTSPDVTFEMYETERRHENRWVDVMVGNLYRIKEYPAKGFQTPQEIPAEVLKAYEDLLKLGYTKFIT
jgi:uncharacterized SAM-binding protein YcdF (DUF218 family)